MHKIPKAPQSDFLAPFLILSIKQCSRRLSAAVMIMIMIMKEWVEKLYCQRFLLSARAFGKDRSSLTDNHHWRFVPVYSPLY